MFFKQIFLAIFSVFKSAKIAFVALALLAAASVWIITDNWLVQANSSAPLVADSSHHSQASELINKGAYLAKVGNCAGCHSLAGHDSYAGGYGVPTPFGTIYASNITPDKANGIGHWSSDDFWQAMHHGRSKPKLTENIFFGKKLLYPAFPYPSYTKVTRADSDALFAFLQSQPASQQPSQAHTLRFPFNTQAALAVWRTLFFKTSQTLEHAQVPQSTPQSAAISRGEYLVQGLGHCDACHADRGLLGATKTGLQGGLIAGLNWYAPSLHLGDIGTGFDGADALAQLSSYLRSGVSDSNYASGPMAEVVYGSTQFFSEIDLQAVGTYLLSLKSATMAPPASLREPMESKLGASLYEKHCESCHGKEGLGLAKAYPAMAKNISITNDTKNGRAHNLIRILVEGGFSPATSTNPEPYGMPPYAHQLNAQEMAAVLTHIRSSFGNRAGFITEFDVLKAR